VKAARIHEFGSPEVIRIDDVPQPTPNEGQILVRVDPSWNKGWIGSRAGEDSTQGGER
jgi:hypothetical protein